MTTGTPVPHPEDCEVFPTEGRSFLNQPSSFSPFIFPRSVSLMRAGRGFFYAVVQAAERRLSGPMPQNPAAPVPDYKRFRQKRGVTRKRSARFSVPCPDGSLFPPPYSIGAPQMCRVSQAYRPVRRYVKISRRANRRKTYTVIIVVCAPQCYNEMNKNGT